MSATEGSCSALPIVCFFLLSLGGTSAHAAELFDGYIPCADKGICDQKGRVERNTGATRGLGPIEYTNEPVGSRQNGSGQAGSAPQTPCTEEQTGSC